MEEPICKQLEHIAYEICDKYCKYPLMPVPEGKDEGWLTEQGGPCENCPLNKLV